MMPNQLMRAYFAALGVLFLVLIVEWLPAGEIVATTAPRIPRVTHPVTGIESKDTATWAEAITARPLFTISRRPAKAKADGGPATDTGLPRLAGIMITAAGKRAIFMPDGGKPRTLREGAMLDENTIRQIRADEVLLSGPKGDIVLRPTYDKQQHQGGFVLPTPNFPQPGFPQPGFNPGFNPAFNPAFNPQPFQPQQPPPANNDDQGDTPPANPTPPPPAPFMGFRGPPRGRP
jgi:hypothetical protein